LGQTLRAMPALPDLGLRSSNGLASCAGIEVPANPALTLAMLDDNFAPDLLSAALEAIRPTDRVLHLGAGLGVLTAAIARICRPAALLAFESDPALLAQARAVFCHNGVDAEIMLRPGTVVAEPPASDGADPSPVIAHARLRLGYLHNVIILQTGGEEQAFLRQANLAGVRLVLVALHPSVYGREGVRACRRALRRAGYECDLGLSRAELGVFHRVRA
jgi:threonine dehydrogenase-like Zn-dependent dehydrogenase